MSDGFGWRAVGAELVTWALIVLGWELGRDVTLVVAAAGGATQVRVVRKVLIFIPQNDDFKLRMLVLPTHDGVVVFK